MGEAAAIFDRCQLNDCVLVVAAHPEGKRAKAAGNKNRTQTNMLPLWRTVKKDTASMEGALLWAKRSAARRNIM